MTNTRSSAPRDGPPPPRHESLGSRERAVAAREAAAGNREEALSDREDTADRREEGLRACETAAQALAERDALMHRLREANEHLVLANVRAQHLAEQAGHLAAIVESTDDAIYGQTLDGIITSWNRGAERMYGYEAHEMIGAPVAVLVPPALPGELPAMLERLRGGATVDRFETMRVRKDGAWIDVALTISPIRDEAGLVVAASTIAREITERRRVERERAELLRREQEARADAEMANRLKDQFLTTVSHELRTPLNAVLGWARMITSHQVEGQHAVALDTIERNATALALIIDDLLDVSRIVAGKLELTLEPVDLMAVASAALGAVRPFASSRHIDLGLFPDSNAPVFVTGDAGRLEQVVGNLLTNAVKFTPEGGRVDVSLARAGAEMRLTVTDTGQGIEPAFLPHVFERFRQADASVARRAGGLGLGLAIVRQLVELHGGTVHAASQGKGRGSAFTVCLPIPADNAAEQRPVLARLGAGAPSTSPGGERLDGVRVLVVDDNEDGRTLTALLLTHSGATVNAVASAQEALQVVHVEPPDVLVTDIGLPDEDGYVLLGRMREQQSTQGRFTPAIALTGYGGIEDHRRMLASGFQSHIVKPFEPAELIAAIASFAHAWQR